MKNLSIMLKPASALCNMRCKYCFYADISNQREVRCYGIMTEATTDAILEYIRSDLVPGDQIQFAFQGGEPTLAGLPFFRHFLSVVSQWDSRIQVSYALQTNGLLLDDDWCVFLAQHNFLVGLSLDLLPKSHNSNRVDADRKGTYHRIITAMEALQKHKVEFNILCTLTSEIARHPQQVWKQIQALDLQYIQFTPCLDELKHPGESVFALTPRRFASFYNQLFQLWLAEYRSGRYRSIKFFDDVVNLIAYRIPTACGIQGVCHPQLVVESDGSTFPCDFYCLDEYKLGNLAESPLRQIVTSPINRDFSQRPHAQPALCSDCPFRRFCGGNCKRMQREICCSGEDNYCGYRDFLSQNMTDLQQIARFLQHNHR